MLVARVCSATLLLLHMEWDDPSLLGKNTPAGIKLPTYEQKSPPCHICHNSSTYTAQLGAKRRAKNHAFERILVGFLWSKKKRTIKLGTRKLKLDVERISGGFLVEKKEI